MKIETIDDILPAVTGRSDFVIAEKDGYTVIDYVYQDKDTFDDPRRVECRGLKFGRDGKVLARPFRKFFNVGEREQPHEIDLTRPHAVLEKLDGSMIHPAMVDGSIVFMTRMGVTDVAEKARERFLHRPEYFDFCRYWIDAGVTPIFEYTGPENRIVLRYESSGLTLLAIRDNVSGDYLPTAQVRDEAHRSGIPAASEATFTNETGDLAAILDHTRALEDKEGYVIHFEDGHMLKMKAEDYVLKHRALDDLASKKKVTALVLQGFQDDVLPMLDDTDANELRDYASAVNRQVDQIATRATGIVGENRNLDRKAFALDVVGKQPDWMKPILFGHLDGKDAGALVRGMLERRVELIETEWRGE